MSVKNEECDQAPGIYIDLNLAGQRRMQKGSFRSGKFGIIMYLAICKKHGL